MHERSLFVMLLAFVSLLIAGCSSTGSEMMPGQDQVPQSGPLAMYPKPTDGMDALLEGTLTVTDDCVTIAHSDGTRSVPVFPAGDASWNEGVLSWRGGEFGEGDPISVGGGLFAAPLTASYIPAGCQSFDAFAVSPF